MGCCLLSEAAIANQRVTVAPSMHQIRTLSFPGYLTTMIFSNDPRYGSHLAEDQGQLSIVHIWKVETRVHLHSSFFQMWFIGKRSVQSHEKVIRVWLEKVIRVLSNWRVSFLLASCVPKWNAQSSVFDGFGRKCHWWKNLVRVSRPSSRCVSVMSSVYWKTVGPTFIGTKHTFLGYFFRYVTQ
jgi:hypothetical protein